MKNLIIAGLVACTIVLTGCVSVEGTKAQLASGDPAKVKDAEKLLTRIIGNGDRDSDQDLVWYSTEDKIEFVKIVPNDEVMLDALDLAMNWFYRYHKADGRVITAAIQHLKLTSKDSATRFAAWMLQNDESLRLLFNDNEGQKFQDVRDRALKLLNEDDLVKILSDYAMKANKHELYNIHPDRDLPYELLKRGVKGLDDMHPLEWKFRPRSKPYFARLAEVAQSADLLAKILLGVIRDLRDDEFVKLQEQIEVRLLPKVGEISDPLLVEKLLEHRINYQIECVKNNKLKLKLIIQLPKDKQEKMALESIKKIWQNHWTEIDNGKYEIAIIAASATKDPAVKIKVADAMLKEIFNVMKSKNEWNDFLHKWDEKDREMADKIVARLVKMAGDEWFAATISSLEKAPEFVTKHITPEVAAIAIEKGGVKSLKMEDALAQMVPAEKITMKMHKSMRSANAQKTLAERMPKNVKAELAESAKKDVERVLATAKAKEKETFVLGGFYVGMSMEDAYVLLSHYVGQDRKIERGPYKECEGIALYGQSDWFAISYSDDKKTVRELNLGPWILRKFCDYDAQNMAEWARAFERDKGYKMSPKAISEKGTIWVADDSYSIFLNQVAMRHRNGKQGIELTYFGERTFKSRESLVEREGPRHFADYSAAEGTLRIERWHE